MNEHKKYLTETVPLIIKSLKTDKEPAFGIMTAQHMIEHLIYVTKSSVKDFGPPPSELTEKQLGFMRFVEKGTKMVHRPSSKKREDLDPPRMADLGAAIQILPEAIARLYTFNNDHIFYNPLMGKLSFEQLETFHAGHYRYHLEEQFGLGLDL